jgi:hypothetical protein
MPHNGMSNRLLALLYFTEIPERLERLCKLRLPQLPDNDAGQRYHMSSRLLALSYFKLSKSVMLGFSNLVGSDCQRTEK